VCVCGYVCECVSVCVCVCVCVGERCLYICIVCAICMLAFMPRGVVQRPRSVHSCLIRSSEKCACLLFFISQSSCASLSATPVPILKATPSTYHSFQREVTRTECRYSRTFRKSLCLQNVNAPYSCGSGL
jgi:hypothetical protein